MQLRVTHGHIGPGEWLLNGDEDFLRLARIGEAHAPLGKLSGGQQAFAHYGHAQMARVLADFRIKGPYDISRSLQHLHILAVAVQQQARNLYSGVGSAGALC